MAQRKRTPFLAADSHRRQATLHVRPSRIGTTRITIIDLFSVAREVKSDLHSFDPRSTDSRGNEPGHIRLREHADHFVIRRVDQTSPVRVEQLPLRTRI